jgi:hypothetical protein
MEAPVADTRKRLEMFCETWNAMIPALKENYLVEPLLNRKINLGVGDSRYVLNLTEVEAVLSDGEDPFAHASFSTDEAGWTELLTGESNFLTLAMQKRMTTRMDEALLHLRLSIMFQLLSLMRISMEQA